jgi:hypothetical protein
MAKKNVEAALLALAGGVSIVRAAEMVPCSERTLRRRLKEPAFKDRVSEVRGELFQAAVGKLLALGSRSVDELHRLILAGQNDGVKLGAARAALGFMLQSHEMETLAKELADLRQRVSEIMGGKQHS